jgi:septum formation protein
MLILASASPRRKSLMREAGYRFRVIPSHASERHPAGLSPAQIVQYLAYKKAKTVARHHPEAVVLGSDTVVYIHGQLVGKPRNKTHAKRILSKLSGSWQKVYSGVAVVWARGKKKRVGYALSKVKLRKLTPFDLKKAAMRHLDKAGAYAVQQKDDPFVEKIIGDYDNVVGLPMRLVKKFLSAAL